MRKRFMQSVNGLQYFSTLIQVASAMGELQWQYAEYNGILDTSQCEFTIINMKYMLGNPHCMLLGAGLGEQKMSVFVYEEALRRLCPPQPAVGEENYELFFCIKKDYRPGRTDETTVPPDVSHRLSPKDATTKQGAATSRWI